MRLLFSPPLSFILTAKQGFHTRFTYKKKKDEKKVIFFSNSF